MREETRRLRSYIIEHSQYERQRLGMLHIAIYCYLGWWTMMVVIRYKLYGEC